MRLNATTKQDQIARNCMLVSLRISQWTGRKLDREATETAIQSANADKSAGRFNKHLIPVLEKVRKVVNAARGEYYALTLPWADNGLRVVSTTSYNVLQRKLEEYREQFEALIKNEIGPEYPRLIQEERKRLGSMYRASDYPTSEEFLSRFLFRWTCYPLPLSDDFRIAVSDEERASIQAETSRAVGESIQAAVDEVWTRLRDALQKAYERLSMPNAIFRDSLIGNVVNIADLAPSLNITRDPDLARVAGLVHAEFNLADPEVLRKRGEARRALAARTVALIKALDDARLGPAPAPVQDSKLVEVEKQAVKFDF